MFSNIKSRSSLFRVAALSLLMAGCMKRKVKVEEILVNEVLIQIPEGQKTLRVTKDSDVAIQELVKSIHVAKEAEGDDGQKYHLVIYLINTLSGTKSRNRDLARQRAEEATKIATDRGYSGPVSFICHVASTPGVKFSISTAGAGDPLPVALDKMFGADKPEKAKSTQKSKPAVKVPPAAPKVDDDDDDDVQAA